MGILVDIKTSQEEIKMTDSTMVRLTVFYIDIETACRSILDIAEGSQSAVDALVAQHDYRVGGHDSLTGGRIVEVRYEVCA